MLKTHDHMTYHDEDSPVHTVGRKIRPIVFSASAELLAEGVRFNDAMQHLSGNCTCIPKGVYRFKSHEDANQFDLNCLIQKMIKISKERV
jgi:glutaredoxin 2